MECRCLGSTDGAKHNTDFSESRLQAPSCSLSLFVSQLRGPRMPQPLALAASPHRPPNMERCDGNDVSQSILRDLRREVFSSHES